MTNTHTAKLFLDDKVAIGQMYRTLGVTPQFTLTNVGVDKHEDGVQSLWRTYTLSTEGFECDIKETFPDRRIFISDACAKRILGIVTGTLDPAQEGDGNGEPLKAAPALYVY